MIDDLQNLWAGAVLVFTWIGAFFVWLRGLLRKRPPIQTFMARDLTFWQSVRAKLAFIKTKLVAGFLMFASALVAAYDFAAMIATGIDWYPIHNLLPPWAWPLIWFAIGALFYWLRHITAQETNQIAAAVEAGNTPREAVMMVATGEAPLLNMAQKVT